MKNEANKREDPAVADALHGDTDDEEFVDYDKGQTDDQE